MTQQAQTPASPAPQTEATPTTPSASSGSTFDERFAAIKEEIRTEATSQAAGESAAFPVAPQTGEAVNSPVALEDKAAKDRADRKARLDALMREERGHVDMKARLAEQDRVTREVQELRQVRAQLEQQLQGRIDPSDLADPAKFYDLAERAQVDPGKLGEWIREKIANPERAAAEAAKRALDPEVSSLRQEVMALREREMQREAAWRQQQQQAEAQHMTQSFLSSVAQAKETAPLTSQYLERVGHEEFLQTANLAAKSLPPGAGQEALLDVIENFLDHNGRQYAQQLAELYGLVPSTPSNGHAASPNIAAAKAATKTVSNSLAQERASVVQEDEWAKLPYEERLARLKRTA